MSLDTGNLKGQAPDMMLTPAAQPPDGAPSVDTRMDDDPNDYEPSDASSYDPAAALLDDVTQSHGKLNKRKSPGSTDLNQSDSAKRLRMTEDEPVGSRKLTGSVADRAKQLPAEIWQHIFTFVPPRALGCLLSVNKLFYAFLNLSSSINPPSHRHDLPCALPHLKPDAIWQASRRLFWPRIPAPLKGKSELQMWRLICSVSCQFCGAKGDQNDSQTHGPGAKGVYPIFPFCVCTCGSCLVKRSVKEIDVLLSSSIPSLLLPALPPVLMTDQLRVIPPRVMQTGVLPPNTQVTKIFWSEHVNQIQEEFEQVKILGSAAAEEWIKGLEIRGKQALVDASRWEKWDLAGGLQLVRTSLHPTKPEPTGAGNLSLDEPPAPKPPLNQRLADTAHSHGEQQDRATGANEMPGLTAKPDTANQQPRTQGQQKRTKEEVAQLKAQRRADIERRALLLEPPLTASVLAHIPSFQAALQIITPLDDNAWELLRPRLLAQRKDAELREKENAANAQTFHDKLVTQQNNSRPAREPREVSDQEWDDAQGPVRTRISNYADEIIKGWNNGEKLKKKNCPQFAADVLLYVRKRFYAEVAKDTAAAIAAGKQPIVEPPEGPWTQKLTLENMKWVFDMKVKPHTEQFRKELFLCNGCGGNLKFFGFEGVIQHYAAKHTSALSLGNVVVHWRAEWPEVPPFSPEPRTLELAHYGKSASYSLQPGGTQAPAGYASYQPGAPPGYCPPSYGAPVPGLPPPYGSSPQVPVPTVNPYSQSGPHAYGAPYSTASYPDNAAYASYPLQPFSGGYSSHEQHTGYSGPPVSAPPAFEYGQYPNLQSTYDANSPDDLYKTRLDVMTKVTKDTWFKMAGVNNLPTSVKVYAVIHHIAKVFHNDYHEAAPVAMFIDGLSNYKEMRCVRHTYGLGCNVCFKNRSFSLPQLLNHLMKEHVEAPQAQALSPDMVTLPQESSLYGVQHMLKNNHSAYVIVADAIPWAFEKAFTDNAPQQRSPEAKPEKTPLNENLSGNSENSAAVLRKRDGHQHQTIEAIQTGNRMQEPASYGNQDHREAQEETDPGQKPTQTQPRSQSEHDVPHLRPASEVYGRKKGRVAEVQERSTASTSGPGTPRSDRRPASDIGRDDQLGRRDQRSEVKIEHASNKKARSGPVQSQQAAHWRDERSLDYRDVREQRYSGTGQAGPRERSPSVGNRPLDYRRSVHPSADAAPRFVEARDDSQRGAIENYRDAVEEEVIYVDPSGREIGRGMRARDTLPQDSGYGVADDGLFDSRGPPPPSRWYDDRGPVRYREHSPRARHAPPEYQYEPDPGPHRVYYDYREPPALPRPPIEAYELVQVRDSQGDYYIRRPVRQDERDYYSYSARPPPRDYGGHPPHQGIDGHPSDRMNHYAPDPRAVCSASGGQPPTRVEYDDYDPRYPTAGTGGRASYHRNAR